MSLAEFQRAMSDLVASPSLCRAVVDVPRAALAGYALDPRERRRLEAIARAPGMRVNLMLYRLNRVTPIYSLLPRTCSALGERLRALLDEFWVHDPDTDLQFVAESERFATWLAGRAGDGGHDAFVVDVLRYEQALNRLKYGGETAPAQLLVRVRHDPAVVSAPPEVLVDAPTPSRVDACLRLERSGNEVLTYRA